MLQPVHHRGVEVRVAVAELLGRGARAGVRTVRVVLIEAHRGIGAVVGAWVGGLRGLSVGCGAAAYPEAFGGDGEVPGRQVCLGGGCPGCGLAWRIT